jgi:hypothetical protein
VVIQRNLVVALVFLMGFKNQNENNNVIFTFAEKELQKLNMIYNHDSNYYNNNNNENNKNKNTNLHIIDEEKPNKNENINLVETHFLFLLCTILKMDYEDFRNLNKTENYNNLKHKINDLKLNWDSNSSSKAAFEILINNSYKTCWQHIDFILPIFKHQVQPKKQPQQNSSEAIALSYAAQRGEEPIPNSGDVDVRLSLLALLENFVRLGTQSWECGQYIAYSSEIIFLDIIVVNLVWRVGRVESTIRKVALAVCYGVLKAGAVSTENLFKVAQELVPLLVSHLDDSESTPRQLSCLCLSVFFDRMKQYFSDQSIREIYPKLIARLDDSSDIVRITACSTLEKFLQCGVNKNCYTGTLIDYVLDQLFIHLDDGDESIQNSVFNVIVVASNIDKNLVVKKAHENRVSHRTTKMCDRVLFEVEGFEILND